MVEFDKILEEMGRLSRHQWAHVILMFIPSILVACHMGSMVFLAYPVDHRCEFPGEKQLEQACNESFTANQIDKYVPMKNGELSKCVRYNLTLLEDAKNCSYWWGNSYMELNDSSNTNLDYLPQISCKSWVYNESSIFTKTIVSEFDLVCTKDYQRGLTQSIFMVGVTLGCIFWGHISDSYGRKFSFLTSALIGCIFGTCVAFANSYAVFVILKSMSGFCLFASFSTGFVIATEFVAPTNRVRTAQAMQAFFALGFCLLSLYGYFVRNWRTLQLLLSIPFIGFISYHWLIYESPRWLISRKRYKEARKVIRKFLSGFVCAQEIDEVQVLDDFADGKSIDQEKAASNEKISAKHGPLDLVRTPNMRSKSLKLFYCWMVCSCVYYGLTLNSADIGGDPFINLFLSGIVEVPAVFAFIPMLEISGRRLTVCLTFVLSGSACITMMFVPKELLWLNIVLSMTGKFAIAAAFGTLYIYAAELYPTPIRNIGIGVCSSCARMGAIFSPIIAMLSHVAKPLPYVVFGGMSIVGGIVVLFLPEVLGIRLPETLLEGEEFGKDQRRPLDCLIDKLRCCKIKNDKSKRPSVKAGFNSLSEQNNFVEENKV